MKYFGFSDEWSPIWSHNQPAEVAELEQVFSLVYLTIVTIPSYKLNSDLKYDFNHFKTHGEIPKAFNLGSN